MKTVAEVMKLYHELKNRKVISKHIIVSSIESKTTHVFFEVTKITRTYNPLVLTIRGKQKDDLKDVESDYDIRYGEIVFQQHDIMDIEEAEQ